MRTSSASLSSAEIPGNGTDINKAGISISGSPSFVISIAHRLSSISDAERIVVLEEGYIVEMGSHNELLKKRGRYYDLWHLQLNWEES